MKLDFLELVDIDEIQEPGHKVNMVDITVDEDESFILSNGIVSHNSATGMGEKVRDINKHGFYPMRGCAKNVWGLSDKAILENKELNDIMSILGLRFGMTDEEIKNELNYGKIGILCDSDADGSGHITTLMINFFYRWKELFSQKRIYMITSPRYIISRNRGKKNEEYFYCFTKEEYEDFIGCHDMTKLVTRYIKGLGSLSSHEYKHVITDESHWLCIEIDDASCLDVMFGDDVNKRRQIMGV